MALRFINIRRRPAKPQQGLMAVGPAVFPCALGRGGISALKREGDGATPLAVMALLGGYRKYPLKAARSPLPVGQIRKDLGWCDAPSDPSYNRPVRLPYRASHERMLRADPLYDLCIVLDWNISERRRNRGSAIFLHIARPGLQPTEGCVAVSPETMRRLLPHLSRQTRLRICR
jgi:L,D-peptidoglycan transpeptidase YkuD (ErfK/YbiS/YcfS/YnhG family)